VGSQGINMKLLFQSPLALSPDPELSKLSYSLFEKTVNLVKRVDTEVVRKHVAHGIFSLEHHSYAGLRYLNNLSILKSMIQAEKEGYDGVISSCYFDPAIKAAKQLLRIPVVGSAESSMHLACMMGYKFAVVTRNTKYIPEIEDLIYHYRMADRVINRKPVRSLTLSNIDIINCLYGNYTLVIENFNEVGKTCIEDGAEIIIIGCGFISPMLSTSGTRHLDNVPIIDPIMVGIKTAEMLVDLKKAGIPTISRKGLYLTPPYEDVEEVLQLISK